MIKAKKFNLITLQASIFTPALQFSANKTLGGLVSKFSSIFDGPPISFPLPQTAPQDIPRLILKDSAEKFKLEVTLNRVNCFRYLKSDDGIIDQDDFFKQVVLIFKEYVSLTFAKIGRLAIVAVRVMKEENPGEVLAQHFCKDKWIEGKLLPYNFEVHSHKKYTLDGFNVNNWFRCKSGRMIKSTDNVIVVEQDMNTLSEELEKKDFSMGQITEFLGKAFMEQYNLLATFFPNNE